MNIVFKSYLVAVIAGALLVGGGVLLSEIGLAPSGGIDVAEADSNPSTSTVAVGNATPVVTVVSIDAAASEVSLTENTTKFVTITATITDSNGCEDVFTSGTIAGALYRSGAASASSCSDDAADCYQTMTFVEVGNTCDGAVDTSGDVVATASVWYFADPTDSSSTLTAENWLAVVTATDEAGAAASSTDDIEMVSLAAMNVDASIDLAADSGSLAPGVTSTIDDINQSTTTVTNTGNSIIDLELTAANMTSAGNTIPSSNEKFATSVLGYESLTYTASSTAQTIEIDLAIATASGSTSEEETYWGINIPSGQASGTYEGTNAFISAYESS